MEFWWILMNFDEICVSSFSSVSTKFWKFSSQGARTRWELAETSKNFFFWKFFRGRKNGSKLHFSHFEWWFFINFASMLREFWPSGPRWGCTLPESEERIEKFVDTAENEPRQKCDFLGSFSLKENGPNLHEHNFAKSAQNQLKLTGSLGQHR